MHPTCSNNMPPLPPSTCGPEPSPLIALGTQVDSYLQNLMATITPDMLEANGRLRLVVANETLATVVRGLLEARGHTYVDVEVSTPVPTPQKWTPAVVEAKQLAHRAMQPRHASPFAKSQPTTKARKAARKRAKAGRKASR